MHESRPLALRVLGTMADGNQAELRDTICILAPTIGSTLHTVGQEDKDRILRDNETEKDLCGILRHSLSVGGETNQHVEYTCRHVTTVVTAWSSPARD